jgi:O-antigen/teichoic acid export membrane protein
METKEENSYLPLNRQSIPSLVFGILTVLFLCLSMVPFPFTTLICFPISFLCGILALVYGVISLNQIRQRNESGRPMAWIGIMSGGFMLLCVICMVIAVAALFIFAPNSFHLPPFIQNFNV